MYGTRGPVVVVGLAIYDTMQYVEVKDNFKIHDAVQMHATACRRISESMRGLPFVNFLFQKEGKQKNKKYEIIKEGSALVF